MNPLSATLWRIVLLVLSLVVLWWLRGPALLLFGAVLTAATLRALADPLSSRTGLSPRLAVVLVVLVLSAGTVVGLWLLGDPLAEQLQALRTELPRAWQALRDWLDRQPLGQRLVELAGQIGPDELPWQNIAGLAGKTLSGVGGLVLILLMGLYLAFDVPLYRNGLVRLVPPARRAEASDALDAAGHALKRWLLGQAVIMLIIAVVVASGLGLLGMPLALALGVIAGLLNFVPFFGPIASGLLAVLVAFVQGPQLALYVALLFVGIQQLEGNLLVPLVQRWAVQLPPVLALGGVLAFGTLFGVAGVLFASPLTVVAMVLIQRLYVQHTLEKGSAP